MMIKQHRYLDDSRNGIAFKSAIVSIGFSCVNDWLSIMIAAKEQRVLDHRFTFFIQFYEFSFAF